MTKIRAERLSPDSEDGGEGLVQSAGQEASLPALYAPPGLQELAEYVRNDWQNFLGVKRGRDPLAATRRFVGLDERADFGSSEWMVDFRATLEEETELVFFSNDARVWEMYAAEQPPGRGRCDRGPP